jgi:hypothetical protein
VRSAPDPESREPGARDPEEPGSGLVCALTGQPPVTAANCFWYFCSVFWSRAFML